MSERMINRRQAVRAAAGVAAGSVLLAGTGAASASADGHDGLLGAWMVEHQATDPESDEVGSGVVAFAEGGVLITAEIKPHGPGGLGAWEWKDNDRFKGTFWASAPGHEGEPEVSYKIEVWGKVDGDEIKGTYELTVWDADGNEVWTEKGKFWGERLEA